MKAKIFIRVSSGKSNIKDDTDDMNSYRYMRTFSNRKQLHEF